MRLQHKMTPRGSKMAGLVMKASVHTHTELNGNESTLQVFVNSEAQTELKLELREKSKSM